nr:hypothetical protein [Paraburkholderia sp. BL8N3]
MYDREVAVPPLLATYRDGQTDDLPLPLSEAFAQMRSLVRALFISSV